MASHIHLSTLQYHSHITKTSPHYHQPLKNHSHSIRNTHILRAQGRGFGVSTTSNKKQVQEKSKDNKSSNNNINKNEEDEDVIPEVVFNRMLVRVLLCVGLPMGSGIGLLYLLGALKEKGIWASPGWVPFLAILVTFGTSALGIAYGTLSSSWSVENDGTLLGWEQVQKNWPELWKEENKPEM